MEDYIFLIIAILISLFGALNKKKKAGADSLEDQPPVRSSRNDPFLNFEMADMEDEEQEAPARKVQEAQARRDGKVNPFLNFEMMGMEDEEEEYERKRKEEQARREREIQARQVNEALRAKLQSRREPEKDKIFHPNRFRSTLPDRPKKESLRPQIRVMEEEDTMETQERGSYLEDFSLRKAIIYSTILERKF